MGTRAVAGKNRYTFMQMPGTLYDLLADSAASHEGSLAIVDDDGARYTYGDLLSLTDGMAAYLASRYGVGEGDRVGILLDASIEFCAVYFACSKVGAVAVPLSTKSRERRSAPVGSCRPLRPSDRSALPRPRGFRRGGRFPCRISRVWRGFGRVRLRGRPQALPEPVRSGLWSRTRS
ncbi:MAG: AMP-binding protein [Collinsella intestinalis]